MLDCDGNLLFVLKWWWDFVRLVDILCVYCNNIVNYSRRGGRSCGN